MGTLRFVTLTGADEKTSFARMARISAQTPFVEWGVLFSATNAGKENRYPPLEWLEKFAEKANAKKMNVALHLCGRIVKDLVAHAASNEFSDETKRVVTLAAKFGRVQLNTRAKLAEELSFRALIEKLSRNEMRTRVILQWNSHNEGMCQQLASMAPFEVLVDASGGRGVERTDWPVLDRYTARRPGFAGGLGPDTIRAQLDKISNAAGGRTFWVDMEGRIRDANDRFDLERCERVLQETQVFLNKQRRLVENAYGKRASKVSSLKGRWLDWWVARAIGHDCNLVIPPEDACATVLLDRHEGTFDTFSPSKESHLAMSIIASERIALYPLIGGTWRASFVEQPHRRLEADTLELAGLRAVVAKHFGETVPRDIFGKKYLT